MPSTDRQEIHGTKVIVIIPAHENFGDIIACINSLQAERQHLQLEFLVIWDGSLDDPCLAQLHLLEAEKRIALIISQSTLGFCNAVNRGLILAQDHDVIVVRDDIRVHGDWADRLHRAACNSVTAGTITPFSNHAHFCGYPKPDTINTLPQDLSYDKLDDLTRSANTALTHEIPSADGPIFYLKRACIKQIGLFDNIKFRDHDAAILDFCVRASNRGFTHLLCADVFVYRISSLSSQRSVTVANMPAWAPLREIYPGPVAAIQHFLTQDPLKALRRHIDIARLATSLKPRFLFVTHRLGGGTEKHVQDLSRLIEDRVETLILRPADPSHISIEWARAGEDFKIFFELPFSYSELLLFLRHLNVSRIHYHHLIELHQQLFDLPKDLNIPYDFTLHDYYSICPQYTLTTKKGEYCGEPPPSTCNTCLQERPAPWGLDIDSWRTLFHRFLASADRVFAPSHDILERTKSYFADANYIYLPHPEFNSTSFSIPTPTQSGRLKILVLGRLSLWKGIKKLEQCALDAKYRSLPLFFRVVGTPGEEVDSNTSSHLSFYGEYNDGEIPNIISLERPNAFLFPALWPESYSYTLSHALRTGLPIVATNIGAFPERLRGYPFSRLVPWDISSSDLNDLLLSLRDQQSSNFIQIEHLQAPLLPPEEFCIRYIKSGIQQTGPTDLDKFARRSPLFDQYYYQDDAVSERRVFFLVRDLLIKTSKQLSDILSASDVPVDSLVNLAYKMTTLVQEQKAELTKGHQRLVNLEQQLAALRDECQERERELIHLRDKHICLIQENEKYRSEITRIVSNDVGLTGEIKNLINDISLLKIQINQLLFDRKTVQDKTNEIRNVYNVIDILRHELRDRDDQLNSLSRENAELKKKISTVTGDYDSEIRRLNQLLLDQGGENLTLQRELASARIVVSEMQKSTSWRLTAPLRALRLAVNKVIPTVPTPPSLLTKKGGVADGPWIDKEPPVEHREMSSAGGIAHFPNNFNPSERFENFSASFRPKVTVIVPNYNHARFLKQRLDSIYNQTYRNFSVILLDDGSSDESREILINYATTYSDNTKLCFNDCNSGFVFRQWKKGIAMAEGDLVWIAESDDFCETNFLEKLVPFFADEAIQLAYARSVFVDRHGNPSDFAFDQYVSDISKEKWKSDYVVTAHNEVMTALGLKNTIPNVSSVVFRRPVSCTILNDESWQKMKICGDWIFYLHVMRGGKIAFTNSTLSYFRFHNANSSARTYRSDVYYKEHETVAKALVELYNIPDEIIQRHYEFVERFYQNIFNKPGKFLPVALYDRQRVLASKSLRRPNILMASYSFSTGGGEILPIRLANRLKDKGYAVTFFNFNREPINLDVRQMLYSDIPVFECNARIGSIDRLISDFGIDLIHSHHASTEHFFATNVIYSKDKVKHVATMHGMYETLHADHIERNLPTIVDSVDLWCYVADKNLTVFKEKGYYQPKRFVKIGNGMQPPLIRAIDRSTLGIPEHAFVLCLASRAIPEKGWREAIEIACKARELSGKDIHLLLLGDGPVVSVLRSEPLPDFVHLLGFVNNPVDYYAMSDLGILPSRFRGECVPLSVIECLFAGKPVVASDIGEIRAMLTTRQGIAGALITLQNWKVPIGESASIIADFASNTARYRDARKLTRKAAERFHLDKVCSDYESAYLRVIAKNKIIADKTMHLESKREMRRR
jgi:glycosyltransferase involved in cell wall biosynthesis